MGSANTHASDQSTSQNRPEQLLQRVRSGAISLTIQHENLESKVDARLRALIVERQIL